LRTDLFSDGPSSACNLGSPKYEPVLARVKFPVLWALGSTITALLTSANMIFAFDAASEAGDAALQVRREAAWSVWTELNAH
jgi:hypothetical protein